MNTRINQVNTPISSSFQFHAVKMPNHAFCKINFLFKKIHPSTSMILIEVQLRIYFLHKHS